MEFEWDPSKETANLAKHGISFAAAAQVIETGTAYTFASDRTGEVRWVAIGSPARRERLVAVVYTMRRGRYRIISARRARANEEAEYWKRVEKEAGEQDAEAQGDPTDE